MSLLSRTAVADLRSEALEFAAMTSNAQWRRAYEDLADAAERLLLYLNKSRFGAP